MFHSFYDVGKSGSVHQNGFPFAVFAVTNKERTRESERTSRVSSFITLFSRKPTYTNANANANNTRKAKTRTHKRNAHAQQQHHHQHHHQQASSSNPLTLHVHLHTSASITREDGKKKKKTPTLPLSHPFNTSAKKNVRNLLFSFSDPRRGRDASPSGAAPAPVPPCRRFHPSCGLR